MNYDKRLARIVNAVLEWQAAIIDAAKANSGDYRAAVARTLAEFVAAVLDYAKHQHETGDKQAVLHAVSVCAKAGLPLPPWAAAAFCKAYEDARDFRCASWDDVFDAPVRKHEKRPAKEQQARLETAVWLRVSQLRKSKPRRNVFPEVAAEFGIGEAVARKYFFAAEKLNRSNPLAGALAELSTVGERLRTLKINRRTD
jgi:hypothetical protein